MKHLLFLFSMVICVTQIQAQNTGDTIVVTSLHHGSATRDTMVSFPDDPGLSFSKILLKYNMRCKDGKISDGSNRNRGCGEWDYSCNTYIHDSSRIDSLNARQISHVISGFTGSSFPYTTLPVYNYYRSYQTDINVDSIISENQSTVGSGSLTLSGTLATTKIKGKAQYLFTSSELISSGVTTGNLHGLMLNVLSTTGQTDFLRIRIKSTSDTILNPGSPHLTGFTEVYYKNTTLSSGLNRFQFHQSYLWNGTSNIVVELSFTNALTSAQVPIQGHNVSVVRSLHTAGDNYFYFNGTNYIESSVYKGITGSNPRTVEAWIKTTKGNGEIVSWGKDVTSGKWNFLINENGQLRVEVNGGFKFGNTDLRDNQWHHVACTFSGNNVTQVNLYVDGILETTGGQTAKAVNTITTDGINLRISRGSNNRYFTGIIDEVRIWDTILNSNVLQDWKYRTVLPTHPQFSHLKAWYALNEGNGTSVTDSSLQNNSAGILLGNQWGKFNGVSLFKEFKEDYQRPNVTFLQGNYLTTATVDTITDSVLNYQHSVVSYQIFPKPGTVKSDSIASSLAYYWMAAYSYTFDTNGLVADSIAIVPQGNFTPVYLNYIKRYPMKFEIMSFVTPYGIGLDLGIGGKTWTFDLTDFSPVLRGKKRLTMEWGGQNQEEMDIQFLFIVGSPPRDVLNIDQIWKVTKPTYTTISQNGEFEPRMYPALSSGKSFKIRSAVTGHGQEGEFIARDHYIDINNNAFRDTWQVWKECADNEIFPQGGTWIYDRAGWCPGAATDVREIDVTASISPGSTARIDYGVVSASGATDYIISNQMVTYGETNFSLDVSVKDIVTPSSAVEYARENFICGNPTVIIQNTGSSVITSVDIVYWINDASEKQTFSWSGNLAFLEQEEVVLPSNSNLWKYMKPVGNRFFAEVQKPNSGTDEYVYNNAMKSDFEIPAVLPGNFIIWFKSNNFGNENSYVVKDEYGNESLKKTSFGNNTEYRDTLNLGVGCYTLEFKDSDDDGIDFWANSDGSGFLRLTDLNGSIIKVFEPDFGKSIIYNFTTDFPLSFEEMQVLTNDAIYIYPNPAITYFKIRLTDSATEKVTIFSSSGQKLELAYEIQGNEFTYDCSGLSKGIYFIQISSENRSETRKVIIQ